MNKTTKTVLTVAILGTGAYLLMKNLKKSSFTGNAGMRKRPFAGVGKRSKMSLTGIENVEIGQRQKHGFAGDASTDVVGNRVRMVGMAGKMSTLDKMEMAGGRVNTQSSGWLRGIDGNGINGAPAEFYNVHSSGWVRS
jgi:hypothetical protein